MRNAEDFDAFYARTRAGLLHQAYALTGDLSAAQHGVRSAYVEAWHHWGQVARLPDPESWVRPRAWAHSQRRAAAKVWHREKTDNPEASATLEALGALSHTQRRLLLLDRLVPGSLDDHAREASLTTAEAERELRSATTGYATARGVDPDRIDLTLAPLAALTGPVRLPRATVVRRDGNARRRSHLVAGVLLAGAAVVASGTFVTGGVSTSLAERSGAAESRPGAAAPGPPSSTSAAALPEAAPMLTPRMMLASSQVRRVSPRRDWKQQPATAARGPAVPCQAARLADPGGAAALVRTFASSGRAGTPARAVQSTELSRSARAARRAFRTGASWYGACNEPRTQLIDTRRVDGVGDQAMVFVLRSWRSPVTTTAIGIARTGRVVTTTASILRGDRDPDVAAQTSLLAAAVNRMCGQPGTAACAAPPRSVPVAPLPLGVAPGLLSELDLPPVTGVARAWVGTEPRRAAYNPAATSCDQTDFRSLSHATTRTFLVPGADLPDTFGLSETAGSLPRRPASLLVDGVRRKVERCARENLGTDVTTLAHRAGKDVDLSVWRFSIEIDDNRTVPVFMAIMRDGTALAQLGFIPSARADLPPGAFQELAERALQRLPRMPPPRLG